MFQKLTTLHKKLLANYKFIGKVHILGTVLLRINALPRENASLE